MVIARGMVTVMVHASLDNGKMRGRGMARLWVIRMAHASLRDGKVRLNRW